MLESQRVSVELLAPQSIHWLFVAGGEVGGAGGREEVGLASLRKERAGGRQPADPGRAGAPAFLWPGTGPRRRVTAPHALCGGRAPAQRLPGRARVCSADPSGVRARSWGSSAACAQAAGPAPFMLVEGSRPQALCGLLADGRRSQVAAWWPAAAGGGVLRRGQQDNLSEAWPSSPGPLAWLAESRLPMTLGGIPRGTRRGCLGASSGCACPSAYSIVAGH